MRFEINVWRKYYNRVKELGARLKDSKHDADGNPPLIDISRTEQDDIQIEINTLMRKSAFYLNATNMMPWRPLWHYNRADQSTWISSPKFKFGHLVRIEVL